MARTRQYKIKGDPSRELLAIQLFNDKAEYGAGWHEVSEETRVRYRKMAAGELPFATNAIRTSEEDHDT
jgi:hypothetical protein